LLELGGAHRLAVSGIAALKPTRIREFPDYDRIKACIAHQTRRELDAAFATLVEQRIVALFLAPNIIFLNWTDDIVALSARHGIATSSAAHEFVASGGLMSYGGNSADAFRQAGVYTGRVLNGAKPADLPVVQSSKFEFAVNLKTAKALGLIVPPSLLAAADEIIE